LLWADETTCDDNTVYHAMVCLFACHTSELSLFPAQYLTISSDLLLWQMHRASHQNCGAWTRSVRTSVMFTH